MPSMRAHRFVTFPVFALSLLALASLHLALPDCGRTETTPGIATTPEKSDILWVVKKTMEHQSSIRMQHEQVNLAKGAHRSSSGDFDWQAETFFVHSRNNAPIPSADPIIKTEDTANVGIKFAKLFRSGVSVEPIFQYTENDYRLLSAPSLNPPSKAGSLGLLFKVPLLRGLGYENVAAGEIATSHELAAEQLALSHEISRSVHEATQAFWAYLAAHARLTVLQEAEERARTILAKTETLAKADEMPAAELVNVRANLADKERDTLSGKQAVVEAQTNLGTAMGIPAKEIRTIPAPQGDFPTVPREQFLQSTATGDDWYIWISTQKRLDAQAAARQSESLKARLQAAKNRAKPALNLELSLGYDGIESGSSLKRSWQTLAYRQDEPDWSAGFRVSYPLGNNSGQGELAQAMARHRQGTLREEELLRLIHKDIGLTRSNLASIALEVDRAEEAIRHYTTAVANEREKYLLGETTLLDLLYIEDRRDSALLNHIALRQRLADNLARLRFTTGTLVRFEEDEGVVTQHDLTTMLLPDGADTP